MDHSAALRAILREADGALRLAARRQLRAGPIAWGETVLRIKQICERELGTPYQVEAKKP